MASLCRNTVETRCGAEVTLEFFLYWPVCGFFFHPSIKNNQFLIFLCCRKSKTKPNGKKPPTEEKKQYLEQEYTKIRVVDFDLKELVVLPREIDLNEWLASNSE